MKQEKKIKVVPTPGVYQVSKPFLAVRWALAGPYWAHKGRAK